MKKVRPVSDSRTNCEREFFEREIYLKLKEAEQEAKSTDKWRSHEEVFSDLRAKLADGM